MKKTLLQIVQSTLGSMDSDAVNHIGETIESEQVALLAQEVYLELATYQRVPQFENLAQLLGLSDLTKATVMRIPEDATDIMDVRYRHTYSNGTSRLENCQFVEPKAFLDAQLQLKVGESNVGENILDDNIRIPYRNDRGPECYTIIDDEHLVFDSIDTVTQGDTTLHNDNSLCIAYIVPEFKLEDDFIPDLPVKLFPQYINQIKEMATYDQKQIQSPFRTRNAERERHRNRHLGSVRDGLDTGTGRRGYGRHSRSGYHAAGSNGLPIIR